MDQSRPTMGLRLAGVAFFCALALTACGGGGDTPAPPANSSLPSNTGGGSGTGSSDPVSTSSATTQGWFRAADTSQSSSTGTTRQLVIIDTRNHTAVLKFDLPAQTPAGSAWYISDAYTAAADGASAHADGASQLYIVQNRRVVRIDLSGSTVGTPQTLSSVSDACGFERTGFIELNLNGKQSWLEVSTAGPDGNCDQTSDNGVMLVASTMDATQPGIPGGNNGLELIETIQESLAAPATGILALDRSNAKLGVYSTDLKNLLYPVDVADHVIQKTERAQSVGHMPSAPYQTLVQLGASLYVSGLSNGKVVLGSPVLQLVAPNEYVDSTADGNQVYLANGTDLMAISQPGLASKLGNLPAASGRVRGMWSTPSAVLVQQSLDVAQNGVAATLRSFSKADGTSKVLVQGPSSSDGEVVGVVDDVVFFRRTTANANWLSDIFKTTAQGAPSTSVATGVFLSAYMWSPQIRLGAIDVLQAVWCQPLPDAEDCGNAPLVSYNLRTEQKLTLGTVPLDAGWANVFAYTADEPFAGRINVMGLPRYTQTPVYASDVVLWTYNADVANSFVRVTAP